MKKTLSRLLMAIIVAISFSACTDNSIWSPVDNRTESQLTTEQTNGDIRGTYVFGVPAVDVSLTGGATDVITFAYTTNTGSGSITFEGSSPLSGTYTSNNLALQVMGTVTTHREGKVQVDSIAPPNYILGMIGSSGTWQLEGGRLLLEGDLFGEVTNDGLTIRPPSIPEAVTTLAFTRTPNSPERRLPTDVYGK